MSANGTLVYRSGNDASTRELVWFDRTGRRLAAATKAASFGAVPVLSPDQRTIALWIGGGSQSGSDIWLMDTTRDVISRFTFRPGLNRSPAWSPDGTLIAFSHQENTGYSFDVYAKASAGAGAEELLLKGGVNTFVLDWSSDGQWILYQLLSDKTRTDLWLLPTAGDRKPVPFLQSPASETNARFAPMLADNRRWVAYQSDESGQNQIYLQSIPAGSAKYQLSTAGGTQPVWRGDGKELFYLSADLKVMTVPVTLGVAVNAGTPKELFSNTGMTGFAASRDEQRFLLNVPVGGDTSASAITVVLNWAQGLNK